MSFWQTPDTKGLNKQFVRHKLQNSVINQGALNFTITTFTINRYKTIINLLLI